MKMILNQQLHSVSYLGFNDGSYKYYPISYPLNSKNLLAVLGPSLKNGF